MLYTRGVQAGRLLTVNNRQQPLTKK
jgi:hypothetical protein